MPAQPFGPQHTRWDQITSKTKMLITHVLCGWPLLLVAWFCPCQQALLCRAIALHMHHGIWKASVVQRNTPTGF